MESKKDKPIKCTVTSIIVGGRRRLNYTYEDNSEMVEEYDMKNHELLLRKLKKTNPFKESQWVFEIGEATQKEGVEEIIVAHNSNPIFIRKDTAMDFQFRIRNLPYPEDVYKIEVDVDKQEIVIKTTNKKYYKRFGIPDMKRINYPIEKEKAHFVYKNNTLIISYPKPDPILKLESDMKKEFDKLNSKKPKEGDIECVQQ